MQYSLLNRPNSTTTSSTSQSNEMQESLLQPPPPPVQDPDESLTEPPIQEPRLNLPCYSDLGTFTHSLHPMTDNDKFHLIQEHFIPDSKYKFPQASNKRSFQYRWLQRYNWLRYSKQDDGGYCLPCSLFFKPSPNFHGDPGVLVTKPLINFQKALEILNKHESREFHKFSVIQMDEFYKVMTNQQPSIRSRLQQAMADKIAVNRQKLYSIIETIVLCGRQNISLRGHRDTFHEVEHAPNAQHGNFWALLQFRMQAGDVILKDHLAQSSRNATYTSSRIQNQILDVLGSTIVFKIIEKVKKATYYTVIADEVTDCSNKEQLSLVLRYVNPEDNLICEDFVAFIECECGITGRALADKILTFLNINGLNPQKLRGQAYDGAGNMSGSLKGTAALITKDYPLALYLHCSSHILNLAVVKSLDEASVRNMIGVVNRVSLFFGAHPKRQRKLEEAIDESQPESKVTKLKDLCRTRWVERIDALDRFKKLLPSLVSCFETISAEGSCRWSSDSLTDSSTLLLAISTTEFLSALVITSTSLNYLMALTKSLQSEAKDIVQAVSEINNILQVFKDLRENVDLNHDQWFAEVEQLGRSIGTELSLPRICGRQAHRSNVPSNTPKEYYRRTITIPLLDNIISEITSRFSKHQQTAVNGLLLVPSILVTRSLADITTVLNEVGEMYSDDLPSPSSLPCEVHTWFLKWTQEKQLHGNQSLPTSLFHSLPHATTLFPNIKELLCILCTLPVTSCSAERSFSGLKRIKTALRSTMGNERLTSLALLHLHRDIEINIPQVIDEFARLYPRRMELHDILAD